MDQVSVIIPTYNMAHYISEAVESVLAQTSAPYEIIVVDDGSNDDTRNVLNQYAPRITYVYQENAGINAARTRGLNEAKGDYIALLDADDRWLPGKLYNQLNFMRTCPQLDLIFTDFSSFNKTGVTRPAHLRNNKPFMEIATESVSNEYPNWKILKQSFLYQYLRGNFIFPSTLIIRKDTCQKFNIWESDFMPREIYEFFFRSLRHLSVAFIDEVFVHRRIHRTSITHSNREKYHLKTIIICQNAENYSWIDEPSILYCREQLVASHFALATYYLSRGNIIKSFKFFQSAFTKSYRLQYLLGYILKRIKRAVIRT